MVPTLSVPAPINRHPRESWIVGPSATYCQTIAALNFGVEFCKVGIGQQDSALQHHDAFDNRDQTASTFEMSTSML